MDPPEPPPSPLEEDLDESDGTSVDSIDVQRVTALHIMDDRLCYECVGSDGDSEIYDRSDLIDGGRIQSLVLAFERLNPPLWDLMCPFCDGDGCEECECPDCERECRFFRGINYGCAKHPVI